MNRPQSNNCATQQLSALADLAIWPRQIPKIPSTATYNEHTKDQESERELKTGKEAETGQDLIEPSKEVHAEDALQVRGAVEFIELRNVVGDEKRLTGNETL